MSPPLQNRKSPLLETFWRRFSRTYQASNQGMGNRAICPPRNEKMFICQVQLQVRIILHPLRK